MSDLSCKREVGCHTCWLIHTKDHLRIFRYALKELLSRIPLNEEAQKHGRSILVHIDAWITPEEEPKNGHSSKN